MRTSALENRFTSTPGLAHQPALPGKIPEPAAQAGDGTERADPAEHRPAAGQPASHPLLPGYRRVRRPAPVAAAGRGGLHRLRPVPARDRPGIHLHQPAGELVRHQPAARRPGAALPEAGPVVPQTPYARRADRPGGRRHQPAGQFLLPALAAPAGQRPAGGGHPGAFDARRPARGRRDAAVHRHHPGRAGA